MRVGLGLPQLGPHVDAGCVRRFATRAEELGFASLWVQEHLFYPHQNTSTYAGRYTPVVNEAYRSVLGPFELLAHVAALTERVTLGTSILVAGYHRPVELAQRAATLDLLSGGRVVLGLGAGWSDEEHAQMDVDPRTRGRRMTELVEALKACWGPDPVSFEGEFFSIPPADVQPKPVQQPHPPLLSGLRSEAGLRRTALQYDIWNPTIGTGVDLAGARATIAAHRPEGADPVRLVGRLYAQRPTSTPGEEPPGVDGLHAHLVAAHEAGADEVIVELGFWDEMRSAADWAEAPDRCAVLLEHAAAL